MFAGALSMIARVLSIFSNSLLAIVRALPYANFCPMKSIVPWLIVHMHLFLLISKPIDLYSVQR